MQRVWLALTGMGLLVGTGCIKDAVGGLETKVYGRLKADAIYNSAQVNDANGNFVQWVSDTTAGGDNVAITANETRLGVDVTGDRLSAKAEIDFYGVGTAQNKSGVLLRKLYAKADLGNGLSLLVGQDSDVFSPLLPSVLNYGWGWNVGNAGYRRPQLRLEYVKEGLSVKAAVARPMGDINCAVPDLQARLGYKLADKGLDVGGSWVWGYTNAAQSEVTNGYAADLSVNLGKAFGVETLEKATLKGEWFMGRNLSNYLGGIGQGVVGGNEIETMGFWVQLGYGLTDKLSLNAGYCMDDPEDTYLVAAGDRLRNKCYFVNVQQKISDNVTAGLEFNQYDTLYGSGTEYTNYRTQLSVIVTF